MEGEGARPGEQAHLRGGCREQAHDGGLGGTAQGAETTAEGVTDPRQHGHWANSFLGGPSEG